MKNKCHSTRAILLTAFLLFAIFYSFGQCIIPITNNQPYFEDFEGNGFDCWTVETSGNGNWSLLTGTLSSVACFTHQNIGDEARFISPVFDMSTLNGATLSFKYSMMGAANNDYLEINYRTSEDDTWHMLDNFSFSDWENVYEGLYILPSPSSTYQISFFGRGFGGTYIFVDDIEVSGNEGCSRPISLNVHEITAFSALLSWSTNGNEDSWLLELNGVEQTINDQPFLLESLTPNGDYTVRIKANCGNGLQSEWSTPITFTTLCDVIIVTNNLPYFDDFESSDTFICWQNEIISGTVGWAIDPGYGNPNNTAFFTWTGETARLISVPLNLTAITNPTLTFNRKQPQQGSLVDELSVYYRNSENEDWQFLNTYGNVANNWEHVSLSLPNPTSYYQICFMGVSFNGNGIYLDEVGVGNGSNYTITATVDPDGSGFVEGQGSYAQGSTCTLRATPNSGYTFVNWLENGTSVSTNATYSFTVTGNRNLVAVFDVATTNYTITATANPTNGGSVDGGGTYASGSTCTLRASANSGYTFVNWTKNGTQVSTNPNYSFTVSGNASYVAHFQQSPTNYTITATANPSNAGIITGTGSYASGSTCILRATPNNGYTFVNWTKNGTQVSTNSTYSFTVTGNGSYVANFEPIPAEYTITVNAEPANGGTVSGGGTYAESSTCVISAMPNDGYVFENWTLNGAEVSTSPSYSFIVSRNATYVAHFAQNANQATITAMAEPVEGGSVSGGGTYELGSNCTLNAVAAVGYEFVNWTLNGSQVSTDASFSFTVTGNAVYVAHFSKIVNHYSVSANVQPANAGSVIGAGTYEEGTSCTLIAIANPTYTFVSWTENGAVASTDEQYTFTVERDRNLVAVFSQGLFYTITASAGGNGSITPEGEVMVNPGEDKTFAIIPNSGCRVSKVLVDGVDVGPVESYTFRSVNANHSIRAQFSGLGVDDNPMYELKVYPNPANDKINIECPNMKRISVFNLFGVQIESKDVNDDHAVFSTDNLSQGTYILKVESQEGRIDYTRFILIK